MDKEISSRHAFSHATYFSTKHDSYFQVYDKCAGKILANSSEPPTIVEIGILHGGSLFMWRELFGSKSRIIGVDLNPQALKWKEHGFEIYIGNQSSQVFWDEFYNEVGGIDFLVDDGGHTNRQQIITTIHALENLKPGGIILIEDTNTSFSKMFGNPSKYSFLNFCKKYINELYSGEKTIPRNRFKTKIDSLNFYDSIVVFEAKSEGSGSSIAVNNGGIRDSSTDFRYSDLGRILGYLKLVFEWSERHANEGFNESILKWLKISSLKTIAAISRFIYQKLLIVRMKLENFRLRTYWRS